MVSSLLLAAQREVGLTKAPCKFLGLAIGDTFEPDPAKWPPEASSGECHTRTKVWFEWPHVFTGDEAQKPHRVSVRADNITHGGQNVYVGFHAPFRVTQLPFFNFSWYDSGTQMEP